jgi:hypothetical protein
MGFLNQKQFTKSWLFPGRFTPFESPRGLFVQLFAARSHHARSPGGLFQVLPPYVVSETKLGKW